MANLFTFWNNGTWETYNNNVELFQYSSGSILGPTTFVSHTLQRDNSHFHSGTFSGKLQFISRANYFSGSTPIAGAFKTNIFNSPPSSRPLVLTNGKKYRLSLWIYTPSGSSIIGSDSMPIVLAPTNWLSNPAFWNTATVVSTTVADCKDTWVKISIDFIYDGASNYEFDLFGYDSDSEASPVLQIDAGLKAKIPSASGACNTNGLLFIDDVTVDQLFPCDLTLGTPSYTKTDESAFGLNDGIISVNGVTSSFTVQFSLDNATWFYANNGLGRIFTNVPPGTYTVYIRDNNPTGCALNIPGIVIVAATNPACHLAFGTPSYTKTNESIANNDATITVNATSDYTISYSLDNITFQSSNVFTGLVPGTYHVYVKDTNPTGCHLEITNIKIYAHGEIVPGTLSEVHLNNYNFIWWRQLSGDKEFNGLVCNGCYISDITNPYTLDKEKIFNHYPIVVPGEEFSFYANLDSPISAVDSSNWRLALANNRGIVLDNIAALSFDEVSFGVFRFYCNNIILPSGYKGVYFLVIYSTTDDTLRYISNEIEVMESIDSADKFKSAKFVSTRVEFRNSYNLYKFNYEILTEFVNRIRLRIYKVDTQPQGTIAQYRAQTTGELRNVSFELDKLLTLETYWFDDYAHEAMIVFHAHDYIQLNAKPYIVQTLYAITRDVRYNVNKGTLMVYDQDFSTANRYGSAQDNNIPVLSGDGTIIGV